VVIVALLYAAIQRSKAPPAEAPAVGPEDREAAERRAAEDRATDRLARKMTGVCLAFVVVLLVLVGAQLLVARALVVHTELGVNDRGHEVVTNHLWLGAADLAWIKAEVEKGGVVASHSSAFATARATIAPLRPQVEGVVGADPGYVFNWDLRFGWPLTVWKAGETQTIGPGGVRWSVTRGEE
jgi:hypothetical protein